jgi:acetyl esterase/lipase
MPEPQPFPESLPGSETHVYKRAPESALRLHLFRPAALAQGPLPAIVFFFGGGWQGGDPSQFEPHARYLARRGMIAACAEYRIGGLHGVSPFECVADGKSAVRWLRANAGDLGIDPARLAAGGGSAGGHVAACAGIIPGLDEPGEDAAVSSVPDALVLFNPVLDTTALGKLRERLGERAREISPYHHIRARLPSTIIFHGTEDATVPFQGVMDFARAATAAGNRCELVPFPGKGHGFFNYGRDDGSAYVETVRAADRFLGSLHFLAGSPQI